jgi:hypothetical protein
MYAVVEKEATYQQDFQHLLITFFSYISGVYLYLFEIVCFFPLQKGSRGRYVFQGKSVTLDLSS